MEVLKQKSERMRHGHIYKKDNSGSQVENVLESEKKLAARRLSTIHTFAQSKIEPSLIFLFPLSFLSNPSASSGDYLKNI